MSDYQRSYPQLSACGLACGLCPRYYTKGASRCPGCCGEGFFLVHPKCGVISCIERHEIEYCYQCEEYPCEKYDKADQYDSFITHQNMFDHFNQVKSQGINAFVNELNEKIAILQLLLNDYNDGRRKNVYCLAVNLLPLADVKTVMAEIEAFPDMDTMTLKDKASMAVKAFQEMAENRSIPLKLNQKNN